MLFEKFTSADLSQIARESCDYLLIVHMYMQKFDSLFLFYVSPFVIVWGGRGGGREPGRTWGGRGTGDGRRKGGKRERNSKRQAFVIVTAYIQSKKRTQQRFLTFI